MTARIRPIIAGIGLNNSDVYSSNSLVRRGKEQFAEVSVFLFLVVPSMILSFFAFKQGTLNFVLVACATILRDLSLVALILFLLWRNVEPVQSIGWKFKKPWNDVVLAIGLFIPFALGFASIEKLLRLAGLSVPSKPLPSFLTPKSPADYLLAVLLVGVVALAEETIFRGYLILRIKAITTSPVLAALLSAVFFSLGHGYEGSAGVITVGLMGLIFAFIYLWRKSLVAPMVMHFLQDFIGIVLLPLLGKG
jgi:CAAX protease family protein